VSDQSEVAATQKASKWRSAEKDGAERSSEFNDGLVGFSEDEKR
jgi:hypothetical protein